MSTDAVTQFDIDPDVTDGEIGRACILPQSLPFCGRTPQSCNPPPGWRGSGRGKRAAAAREAGYEGDTGALAVRAHENFHDPKVQKAMHGRRPKNPEGWQIDPPFDTPEVRAWMVGVLLAGHSISVYGNRARPTLNLGTLAVIRRRARERRKGRR